MAGLALTARAADEHAAAAHPAEPTAAAPHGEAHGAEAHGAEHERPFLDFQPNEAIWIILIFLILVAILYPTAWKQVLAGLKAREDRIRKDIGDAEAARLKAESLLKDYNAQIANAQNTVREMLSSATAEAERIGTQIKMQAQQETEASRERAVKDIEAARRQALQEIYAEAANLSTSIAEKILRRNLNADDQRDLVNQSLEQLQAAGQN
jgi:F-type H+-transporting ATPase subunit b